MSGPRLGAASRREQGLAVVEFLLLTVTLAVPIGYGALAVERLHRATATAQSAAAGAALAVARGDVPAGGVDRVVAGYWRQAALREPVRASVRCAPAPCPSPGGTVTVSVEADLALPLLPPEWGTVSVAGLRSQVVDRFAAAPRNRS